MRAGMSTVLPVKGEAEAGKEAGLSCAKENGGRQTSKIAAKTTPARASVLSRNLLPRDGVGPFIFEEEMSIDVPLFPDNIRHAEPAVRDWTGELRYGGLALPRPRSIQAPR